MITSKHASVVVGISALLGLAALEACSSDPVSVMPGDAGAPSAGMIGVAGGAGAGISGGGAGGVSAAGGAATGGGGASAGTGTSAGTGGSLGGAGGSSGGAVGAMAGAAGAMAGSAGTAGTGGGGTAVSFAAVKTIFSTNCGVGTCHNAASGQLNFQGADLHTTLTQPIPVGTKHCVGTTVVVPNSATSYLLTVVKAASKCPMGTADNIGRMPDGCSTAANATRKCLTDAQIKTLSDWVTAGATAN